MSPLQGESGGTVLLALLLLLISSVFIASTVSIGDRFGRQQRQTNLSDAMAQIADNLRSTLRDPSAWQSTLYSDPILLGCLTSGTCSSGGNLRLFDGGHSIFIDGTDESGGITHQGQPCVTFDAGNGNDDCPIHLALSWSPVRGCVPLVEVRASFGYSPATNRRRLALNPTKYEFRTVMAASGYSRVLGCQINTGSEWISSAARYPIYLDLPTRDEVSFFLSEATTVVISYSARTLSSPGNTDCYDGIFIDGKLVNIAGGGSRSHPRDFPIEGHLQHVATLSSGPHSIGIRHGYNMVPNSCSWSNRVLYVLHTK